MLFVVALVGAIIFAVGALMLNLPIYIVIVNSALAGAALAVAGLLTIFGTIQIEELANGAALAVVNETKLGNASWLWVLAWIVLAVRVSTTSCAALKRPGSPRRSGFRPRPHKSQFRGQSHSGSAGLPALPRRSRHIPGVMPGYA